MVLAVCGGNEVSASLLTGAFDTTIYTITYTPTTSGEPVE